MPREIVVRSPYTLKVSGITSAFHSYTALVMVAPCPTLELRRYHYVLRVPLPGVLRHTLKVHLKDETLAVSGHWEGGDVSGAVFYGSVYRAVLLPADAIPAGFETSLEMDSFVVAIPRRL